MPLNQVRIVWASNGTIGSLLPSPAPGSRPVGVAAGINGTFWMSDQGLGRLLLLQTGGAAPLVSISLPFPGGLAADDLGGVFVAVSEQSVVLRVTATGEQTLYAGQRYIHNFDGDGAAATSASLNWPTAVAWVPKPLTRGSGASVLIADAFNGVIRRVDATTGIISTFAGFGCPQTSYTLPLPPCNAGSRGSSGDVAFSAALRGPTAVYPDGSGETVCFACAWRR